MKNILDGSDIRKEIAGTALEYLLVFHSESQKIISIVWNNEYNIVVNMPVVIQMYLPVWLTCGRNSFVILSKFNIQANYLQILILNLHCETRYTAVWDNVPVSIYQFITAIKPINSGLLEN